MPLNHPIPGVTKGLVVNPQTGDITGTPVWANMLKDNLEYLDGKPSEVTDESLSDAIDGPLTSAALSANYARTITPQSFGGVADNATDATAAFNAMIAAVNSAPADALYRIDLGPGRWIIAGNLDEINRSVEVSGTSANPDANLAGTYFKFNGANASGFRFGPNASKSSLKNVNLRAFATTAGTGDGVRARSRITIENVVSDGFSRHGFSFGGDGPDPGGTFNANNSTLHATRAANNKGNGYHMEGTDANQISFTGGCSAFNNAGWGWYNGLITFHNTMVGCHADQNALGPFYDNGRGNQYLNPYDEFAGEAVLDTLSQGSVWTIGQSSACPTVKDLSNGVGNHFVIKAGRIIMSAGSPFGIVRTLPGTLQASAITIGTANDCRFFRIQEGGSVSQVRIFIGTSGGNISVAAYRNTGKGLSAKPGVRLATSGSIASPGTGPRNIALDSRVYLEPGDWLAISADTNTATFGGITGVGDGTMSDGQVCSTGSAFPCPPVASPALVMTSGNNRMISLIGF